MSAFDKVFTETLKAEVTDIIRKSTQSGEKVAGWEAIQAKLLDAGVAWKVQVPADQVGVHPLNRSTFGVGGSESHHLGAKILRAGWSWKKASDATAIDCPPPPYDEEAKAFNAALSDLSGGFIPPVSQCRLLSIGGSHTNCFLRAVRAGAPSAVSGLGNADGKLDREQLCMGRQSFREAVDKGLHWLVLHSQSPQVWPALVPFVQEALNTHTQEFASETEVLLTMHGLREAALQRGDEVDWSAIAAAATTSLPPCTGHRDSLASYVKSQAPELLLELSTFVKSFAGTGPGRALGSEFWSKLVSLNWGPSERFPYVMHALVAANLVSPAAKVIDGVCRMIPPSSLAAVASKDARADVRAAESLMTDGRKLAQALGLSQADQMRVVGKLDCRLACHLTKKGKDMEGRTFAGISDIGQAFIREVSEAAGRPVVPPGTWGQPAATTTSAGSAEGSAPMVAPPTVAMLHSPAHRAKELGFDVGVVVAPKKSSTTEVWKILTLRDEVRLVKLVEGEHAEEQSIPTGDLLDHWRVHKGKITHKLNGWDAENQQGSPATSVAWATDGVKGAAALALQSCFAKYEEPLRHLELLQQPNGVKATAKFAKGKLVLVPASQRVERCKTTTSVAANAYSLGNFNVAGVEAMFQVSPHFVPPGVGREAARQAWVAPFWLVDGGEGAAANMEIFYEEAAVGPHIVQVPLMRNTRAVNVGDRLVLNKGHKPTPKLRRFEDAGEGASKRSRHS